MEVLGVIQLEEVFGGWRWIWVAVPRVAVVAKAGARWR